MVVSMCCGAGTGGVRFGGLADWVVVVMVVVRG
jgi:hypothetical protein